MPATPQHITQELENGNKLHFKSDPRFGFWTVNFDKGGIPDELSGSYLSLQELQGKVDTYLASREKNKTKVKVDG